MMKNAPLIESAGTVVGKDEYAGPLGVWFDSHEADAKFGMPTWEMAEAEIQRRAVQTALDKQSVPVAEVDMIFGGDLQNQCVATTFGLKAFSRPFIGLYGACSTMAESIGLAAVMIDSGAARRAIAVTSSHFCSAERQFRFPLEYAGQRPPTAQWTVTGGGAALLARADLCKNSCAPKVRAVTFGRMFDLGITDMSNMGAAMAPAACQTICDHLADTAKRLSDFDLVVTGDLGSTGILLLRRLLSEEGHEAGEALADCGCMIYDEKDKDFGCGGSGCGCSAAVLNSVIYQKLLSGVYKDVLFVGTGALMSPLSVSQGEVIPSIAHALHLSSGG